MEEAIVNIIEEEITNIMDEETRINFIPKTNFVIPSCNDFFSYKRNLTQEEMKTVYDCLKTITSEIFNESLIMYGHTGRETIITWLWYSRMGKRKLVDNLMRLKEQGKDICEEVKRINKFNFQNRLLFSTENI